MPQGVEVLAHRFVAGDFPDQFFPRLVGEDIAINDIALVVKMVDVFL